MQYCNALLFKSNFLFITLLLNTVTVTVLTIFTTFLGLEHGSCFAVYAGSESSQISSKIA